MCFRNSSFRLTVSEVTEIYNTAQKVCCFQYDNDNDNDNEIDLFRHHNGNNTNIKVILKQVTMLDKCNCI